ncbi:YunG family protein [Geodermatophilus sp. SYSU D00700]
MSVPDDVVAAVRAAWCRETCDDSDLADWSPQNPARGQCGATALVLHDLLGGDLLLAEVLLPDGSRQGVHWWNRLPDGREVDLTRGQFAPTEVVQEPRVVVRPPGLPRRNRDQYLRLRAAVLGRLGGRARAPG